MRRLERNRESARLSRRRRKHYLEELEEQVMRYSEDVDEGRRQRVAEAVKCIREMRSRQVELIGRQGPAPADEEGNANTRVVELEKSLALLDVNYSRTSDELEITNEFQRQHMKSIVFSSHTRCILWVMLQNEVFFRGGRLSSDRLSAARIGEKMILQGNERVPPSGGMWPLLCHEIGLSYEQEDRIRTWQKQHLAKKQLWVDRYTVDLTWKVINSIHRGTHGTSYAIKRREASIASILTTEQRSRLIPYLHRKRDQLQQFSKKILSPPIRPEPLLNVVADRQDALNLFEMNKLLSSFSDRLPAAPSIVPESKLKRLSRRPSYESLGGSQKELGSSQKEMGSSQKELTSHVSSGQMSSSGSQISLVSSGADDVPMVTEGEGDTQPVTSPEEAQMLAAPYVSAAIGAILTGERGYPTFRTRDNQVATPQVQGVARPPFLIRAEEGDVGVRGNVNSAQQRKNVPMNVVPEEENDFNFNLGTNDNFLMDMTEEDWAIGAFEF